MLARRPSRRTAAALVLSAMLGCVDLKDPAADPSPDGSTGAAPDAAAPNDAGDSAVAEGASIAADRRYALWPIAPAHPLLSQYQLTEHTVTDTTTGLVWERQLSSGVSNWETAEAYCSALQIEGASDWRVPTRIEVMSILDFGQTDFPIVNPDVFAIDTSSSSVTVWTASVLLVDARLDDRVVVNLTNGFVALKDIYPWNRVRCVRGGPATSPLNRYEVADETAKDVRTNLVWQRGSLAPMKWSEASAACSALALGGVSNGWRLPTIRELASLVDESREITPLVSSVFSNDATGLTALWSSTQTIHLSVGRHWFLNVTKARIESADNEETEKLHVRCVR